MNEYDFDPEVPFWRSDDDIAALYAKHAMPCTDTLIELGLVEPDETPTFGPVALMTGRFLPLLSSSATFGWTFTPGIGDEQAIAFPIMEDGKVVDIMVVSVNHSDLWGCVTGHGRMAGSFEPNEPVRIYRSAWQWLLFGCDGVVVLNKDAFAPKSFEFREDGSLRHVVPAPPKLSDASQIYCGSLDHADDLVYLLFERPAVEDSHPALSAQVLRLADQAIKTGRAKIGIDTDRFDLDGELLDRAIAETLRNMKSEGLFA